MADTRGRWLGYRMAPEGRLSIHLGGWVIKPHLSAPQRRPPLSFHSPNRTLPYPGLLSVRSAAVPRR